MHRAYETACAIRAHHPGVPCIVDALFQEVSRTSLEDELESGDGTLLERLEAIWERIVDLTAPVTAIVTHGGLIKYVIGRAIRHEGRLKPRFHSAHTGITALEVKPGRGAQVVFFNDTRHLTPEIAAGPKRPWIEDPATGRWVFR
jgi:broad specificity phosphatase PhoE